MRSGGVSAMFSGSMIVISVGFSSLGASALAPGLPGCGEAFGSCDEALLPPPEQADSSKARAVKALSAVGKDFLFIFLSDLQFGY